MTAPPPPPPPPPSSSPAEPPSAAWAPPPPGAKPTVDGMAVASLVLGLCCWCFFVPGILAIVFGNVALGRIRTAAGQRSGRGLAIAGIVLGWISIAVLGGLAIAWLVYGLGNA